MAKKPLSKGEMANTAEEFEALYEANQPAIYRFMFWRTKDEMLAQDLTSNVFEKAWRTRHNFTGGSAKAWLYKIARTTLVDHWRKKKDVVAEDKAFLQIPSASASAADMLDQGDELDKLQKAVGRLPKEMEQVVKLRFIEGLPSKEVAVRLEISEANARVIQYRALKKLRGYMK